MSNINNTFNKLINSIDDIDKELLKTRWKDMTRNLFVNTLENSVTSLKESQALLKELNSQLSSLDTDAPSLAVILNEFEKTIIVLEKNLKLEKGKTHSGDSVVNITSISEVPELYASLEHKILELLLKTRYVLEDVDLFLRKEQITPVDEKAGAKNLVEILRKRDEEMRELKDNLEKLKKKSFFGYIHEESPADIEKEVHELAKKLEINLEQMKNNYSSYGDRLESMAHNFSLLKEKIKAVEEMFDQFSEKSEELTRILKKERDYAKKIVLEADGETGRVRRSYTQELLGMQKEKVKVREDSELKYRKQIDEIKKDISEKDKMLKEFTDMLSRREHKIDELEERNKELRLLLKAGETHAKAKKTFKQKAKHKE
ncbi:MAG: hypothetical protein V1672_00220 [Candidatus Diapherotrites archaeon]